MVSDPMLLGDKLFLTDSESVNIKMTGSVAMFQFLFGLDKVYHS